MIIMIVLKMLLEDGMVFRNDGGNEGDDIDHLTDDILLRLSIFDNDDPNHDESSLNMTIWPM